MLRLAILICFLLDAMNCNTDVNETTIIRSRSLVRDRSGKLEVDPEGLAFLRSPAVVNQTLKTIGIVGQARTGKSFFMNSLVGRSKVFEVSSGDEGFTKGLWIHQLPEEEEEEEEEEACGLGNATCNKSGMMTLLVDSEGLGAPGGTKVYDTKMVALTAMLSSVFFYNTMRKVNKLDVEFLGDVVMFDEVFRNISDEQFLASSIVWLVQSYSSRDRCEDYPSRFLRKLGDEVNEELVMHDRVIDYVRERMMDNRIFCLPYPKTKPYKAETELAELAFEELDRDYRVLIERVRSFINQVVPKRGLLSRVLTGGELANLVESLVPSLNDVHAAARALISLRAESARHNITARAVLELEEVEGPLRDCSDLPPSMKTLVQECSSVIERLLPTFDQHVLGDATLPENVREKSRLVENLNWIFDATKARIEAGWNRCKPDSIFLVFRDYYLLLYVMQVDVLIRVVLEVYLPCPLLSRGCLAILSSPREVAITSGILNMLPLDMICHEVTQLSHLVSSTHCQGMLRMLASLLRKFVDVWVSWVSPECTRMGQWVEKLLLWNPILILPLLVVLLLVRFLPLSLLARILPPALLLLSFISADPAENFLHAVALAVALLAMIGYIVTDAVSSMTKAPASSKGGEAKEVEQEEQSRVETEAGTPPFLSLAMGSSFGSQSSISIRPKSIETLQAMGRPEQWRKGLDRSLSDTNLHAYERLKLSFRSSGSFAISQMSLGGLREDDDLWMWLNSARLREFRGHTQDKPHVLLFTSKMSLPKLFSYAAKIFRHRIIFGCVHAEEAELMQQYAIDPVLLPRLVLHRKWPNQEEVKVFQGKISLLELCKFLVVSLHEEEDVDLSSTSKELPLIRSQDMAEMSDRSLPLALLFMETETTPRIWSYMSLLFQDVYNFAVVPKSNDMLCELYSIEAFPAMMVIALNGREVYRYEGDVDYSSVSLWLSDVSVKMD